MAKKLIGISTMILLLIVSGCTPSIKKETEVIQDTEQKASKKVIIPSLQLDDTYYRTLLPYEASKSRGLVVSNLSTKYDMKEVETGLLRISQKEFSPDTYLFQEGQFLDGKTIKSWLARSNQTSDGLNPSGEGLTGEEKAKKAPIYISHIVEQDYLKKEGNSVKLAGISVGLALNSIYYYQKEDYGATYEEQLSQKEIEDNGKRIAEEVVARMRQKNEALADIPIVVGLFKQNSRNSVVPGTYFKYSVAPSGKNVSDWKDIDEEYVLFPSADSEKKYRDLDTIFRNFKQDVETYFSNYTSVIGTGYFKDKQLQKLTITIPIQFYGTAEIIGFTQQLAGLVKEFNTSMNVEVNVNSMNGAEALLIKKPGDEEPYVHIYSP